MNALPQDADRALNLQRNATLVIGALLLAFGLLVLLGWHAKIPALLQFRPGLAVVQYNTGLLFALSGAALIAGLTGWPRLAQTCGAVVFAVSTMTLAQYLLGHDLGVDQLFTARDIGAPLLASGHMAASTAVTLFIAGAVLLCCNSGFRRRAPVAYTASLLGVLVVSFAVVSLLGYLIGLETVYQWGGSKDMAPQSTGMQLLLGIGLVLFVWRDVVHGPREATRWFSIVGVATMVVVTLLIAEGMYRAESVRSRSHVAQHAQHTAVLIESGFKERFLAIERMARRWEFSGGTPRAVWDMDARGYIEDLPGYQAIEWVDSAGIVRWVAPLAGNEKAVGLDLTHEPLRRRALEKARTTRKALLSEPIQLAQRGQGFLLVRPLFIKGRFGGYLLAVFRVENFFPYLAGRDMDDTLALEIYWNGETVFRHARPETPAGNLSMAAMAPVTALDAHWQLRLWPALSHADEERTVLPWIVLIAGLASSLLAGLFLRQWQRAQQLVGESTGATMQLRESEQRLRLALGASGYALWDYNVTTGEVYLNDAWAVMLGGEPAPTLTTIEELTAQVHSEDRAMVQAAIVAVFRKETPHYRVEHRVRQRDGGWRWIQSYGEVVERDAQGRALRMVGTNANVTERKQGESRLRETTRLLDSVVENIPNMIFLKRASDLRFVLLNKAGEDLTGYSRTDLLGKNDYDFFPKEQAHAFTNKDREVLVHGFEDIPEEPLDTRHQGKRILHTKKIALHDEEGEPQFLLGISEDITDQIAAEQRQRRQHQLLDSISRAQARFIAEADARVVFDELLLDIRALTGSEYGFVAEVLHTGEGKPYLRSLALTNIAWSEETRRFYDANAARGMEFTNLNTLFGAALTTGKTVIANDAPRDSRAGGLPPGHPPLNAFLGVPLYLGKDMVGMVGLANRPGGFDEVLVEFLQPLFTTVAHLIGAHRADRKRKGAEEALRESATRIHTILDTVIDGIITINERGSVESFNPAAENIFGYQADEVIGRNINMLMPEPYHSGHDGYLHNYRTTGERKIIGLGREVTGRRKDGSTFPMELAVGAMQLGGDRMFVGMVRDISARKQAERELQESRERFREIAETISEVFWVADVAISQMVYISPAYERIWGRSCASLYENPKSFIDGIHPDDRERVFRGLTKQRDGRPFEHEYRVVRPDGSVRWVWDRGFPVPGPDGTVQRYVGIVQDITEQRLAVAGVNRFKQVLDDTLDMIFMFDPSTLRFTYINRGAGESMGYSREELLGMTPYQIKPLMPEPVFREMIAPLLAGDKSILNFETLHRRKDGSDFPVDVSLQLVRETDQPAVFVAIVRDVTERKRIERMKSEFISTVSHELRTPLTSIRGSLGLLSGGVAGAIPEKAKELIEIAHKNSTRLSRLINDILDVEKIESGKMKFDIKPHELMPLVEQSIEAIRGYGQERKVDFRLVASLPQAVANVDADRLSQVLANLLSNAAKFSPEGGRVEVSVTRHSSWVRVSVADNGPGIPAEFHERIFQKFSQADASDTRAKGGSGLGLSISRAIVEKLGGRIGFDSTPGVGATFYFDLREHRALEGLLAPGATTPASAQRLLVCEDDADIARFLSLLLKQSGYEVDVAYDAEQAKDMLRARHYAAMTLDLALPGEDGVSLINELRRHPATRHLPIVVVSANCESGRAQINGGFAVIDWLGKPIDEKHLLSAVERAVHSLGGYRARVLHIEDDADVRQIMASVASDMVDYDFAATVKEAKAKLLLERYHLIILDIGLPDGSGWDVLPVLDRLENPPPVMVFSADDVASDMARQVDMALVKSHTSNEELVKTIRNLVRVGIQSYTDNPDAPEATPPPVQKD